MELKIPANGLGSLHNIWVRSRFSLNMSTFLAQESTRFLHHHLALFRGSHCSLSFADGALTPTPPTPFSTVPVLFSCWGWGGRTDLLRIPTALLRRLCLPPPPPPPSVERACRLPSLQAADRERAIVETRASPTLLPLQLGTWIKAGQAFGCQRGEGGCFGGGSLPISACAPLLELTWRQVPAPVIAREAWGVFPGAPPPPPSS